MTEENTVRPQIPAGTVITPFFAAAFFGLSISKGLFSLILCPMLEESYSALDEEPWLRLGLQEVELVQ
jgi:hypothetical protein